jgi:predicted transcriptional regulator
MQPILVHFEKSDLKRLDAICRRLMIPRAAFIRRALENALDPKTGIQSQIATGLDLAAEEIFNQETREQLSHEQ